MGVGRFATGVLFGLIAAGATAGLHCYDDARAKAYLIDFGLRTARQIAAQAEGLALNAKVRSGSDPLASDPIAWAVGFLAQGVEPRTVQISKYRGPVGVPSEAHLLVQDGWFEYVKVVQPENGAGVKIRLWLGYRGFLDSRSTFANDVALGGFFVLFWCALHGIVGLFGLVRERNVPSLVEPVFATPVPLTQPLTPLIPIVTRGENVVIELGTRMLELLREAGQFRSQVLAGVERRKNSRREVHGQLERLHQARQALKTSGAVFQKFEEALQGNGPMPPREKILALVGATQKMNARLQDSLREMQIELEPLATDLDLAAHADDDTARIAQELSQRIDRTKNALKAQASFVKELRGVAKRDSAA